MNKLSSFHPASSKKWIAMLLILTLANGAFAQGVSNETSFMLIVGLVGVMAALLLIVAIYVLRVLSAIVKSEDEKQAKEKGVVLEPSESLWQRILLIANNRVDMKDEGEIIMDHDYDGIKELNNHLPPWWTYLFYATVVFSIIYVAVYHFTESLPLQEEEYQIEMAEATAMAQIRLAASQADGTAFSEEDLKLSTDPYILASGGKVFAQQCAICHKPDGGGSIGPNLTDEYWIHGGDIKDIFSVTKVGVPDKGMISWEAILSPTQIRDVSNYIISLKGSNPPGAKSPQGELYKEVDLNE